MANEEIDMSIPNEVPGPAKCGCGRSPSGFCVGWHALTEKEFQQVLKAPPTGTPATNDEQPK